MWYQQACRHVVLGRGSEGRSRRAPTSRRPVKLRADSGCETRPDQRPPRLGTAVKGDDGIETRPPIRVEQPAQDDLQDWFFQLASGPWLPLAAATRQMPSHAAVACALAPKTYRPTALSGPGWDLHYGSGRPGFSQRYDSGRTRTSYHRISSAPVEPLVFQREFYGVLPNYDEISEEFRLFHDLYWDAAKAQLLKVDDAGNAHVVGHVERDDVAVLTGLVRQYQAARQLDLLLFVDSVLFFDPSLPAPARKDWKTEDINALLATGDSDGKPFSRFLAKRILPPPPRRYANVWPFESKNERFPEFIIGIGATGSPTQFTCDPDKLANYFGRNAGAPHYLTPVHFRREVLAKYYSRPELYTIESAYLRCGGLWHLPIDMDVEDVVIVYLGDLGEKLPESERDYWRSFNVAPAGSISATAFRRDFLAQWAEPEAVDARFRAAYRSLIEVWQRRYGWPLYLPPEPGDAHLLGVVRQPLLDNDQELEALVRTLAKLLVDSLNEAELTRDVPSGSKDEKGISKFERWLAAANYPRVDACVSFLRRLQDVRSRGVAHRKGRGYEIALNDLFGSRRKAAAAQWLLAKAVEMITALARFAEAPPLT